MASKESETQPKLILYWLDKSRSQRILWLLEELNLTYTLEVFKRGADMRAPDSLRKIHPLGKSPVLGVQAVGQSTPAIIAESGAISEYLTQAYGKQMIPKRWDEGKEGKMGEETDGWLRYTQLMHYAEGSLIPPMVFGLVIDNIRDAPVPFFIKPITRGIAGRVYSLFLNKEYESNFNYLESLLSSSPNKGKFFCGNELTAADVMVQFPLEWAKQNGTLDKTKYPLLTAFVESNQSRPAYKKAIQRVVDETGEFSMDLRAKQ